MTTLYLDIETFCETPITHGTYRYAEDAEVIMVQVAVDDGPVAVWDCSDPERRGSQLYSLQNLINAADEVVIHSQFERLVLPYHDVNLPLAKITDVMLVGLLHSFPGGLGQLCDILEVPVDKAKDKRGKRLINLFTKPQPKNHKLRRATRETHPAEWEEFKEYAGSDVIAMREVLKRLPRWNDTPSERALWHLDQEVNDRGFRCDTALAASALRAFTEASAALAKQTSAATKGAVGSTTQRDALREYLRAECDLDMLDMKGDTVERILRGEVSAEARELLENRQQAAATSPAKYRALLKSVSTKDDRLRGTLQFCGAARTLRDAGRIFQPQNLPRCPDWFDGDAQEATIAAFKAEAEDVIYADVVNRCSYAIRGSLIPADDCELVIADLSNIEGRVAAWLAGEGWKIEAFKAYDRGEGHDLYKVTAGRILGKDPQAVTKPERQRFGKVSELSCAYGGAVGAFRRMGGVAVEGLSDDDIVEIVRGWRAANPRIKALWYAINDAARLAIQNPGNNYVARSLSFGVVNGPNNDTWVRIKCPGGVWLSYRNPRIEQETCERCDGEGEVDFEFKDQVHRLKCSSCGGNGIVGNGEITYEGVDQYTRQWKRLRTYGAKIFENVTQHVARMVFMAGFKRAAAMGFKIVLRVHDELVAEVPIGSGLIKAMLEKCMATNDNWNVGLPLAAAGDVLPRYRKL